MGEVQVKPLARKKDTRVAERVYRAARKAHRASEDEVLNALCDSRLDEPRHPLPELLKKLGHEVAK
jgi:hypothetical protein